MKLINLTFEHYSVPDLLKVGTLTPIYKNKGLMTESKNYRGITITPTLSKIIETILKFRINGNILSVQNPQQRGFTENSTPLIASLVFDEIERENKDRKTPTLRDRPFNLKGGGGGGYGFLFRSEKKFRTTQE